MRVFLLGASSKLAFGHAVGQRLLAAGHSVAAWSESATGNPNCGVEWISGQFDNGGLQQELERADAVIDADLPPGLGLESTRIADRRPALLRDALKGSGKPLIMTSSASVLGDTGPAPVDENAPLHTPPNFAYLARLEEEVCNAEDICGVVIRPGIQHGLSPGTTLVRYWFSLAELCGQGTYIEPGTNCWSAVHGTDLADLYCLALDKARPGMVIHAASETFSMRELADAIQSRFGLTGGGVGIPYEEAAKRTRVATALCRNIAISGEMAQRELGWQPVGRSLLDEIRAMHPLGGSGAKESA
jgi:nucleoside-diphosphate-sugar epimerase